MSISNLIDEWEDPRDEEAPLHDHVDIVRLSLFKYSLRQSSHISAGYQVQYSNSYAPSTWVRLTLYAAYVQLVVNKNTAVSALTVTSRIHTVVIQLYYGFYYCTRLYHAYSYASC